MTKIQSTTKTREMFPAAIAYDAVGKQFRLALRPDGDRHVGCLDLNRADAVRVGMQIVAIAALLAVSQRSSAVRCLPTSVTSSSWCRCSSSRLAVMIRHVKLVFEPLAFGDRSVGALKKVVLHLAKTAAAASVRRVGIFVVVGPSCGGLRVECLFGGHGTFVDGRRLLDCATPE